MCDGKKKVKKISCSGLSGIESKCESACNAPPQCDDRLAGSSLPDECTSSKLEVNRYCSTTCGYSSTIYECNQSYCGVSKSCGGNTYYCVYDNGWKWSTSKPSGFCCGHDDCPGYDPNTHTKLQCNLLTYRCEPKPYCENNDECDINYCCDTITGAKNCRANGTILSYGGKSYLCDPPEGLVETFVETKDNIEKLNKKLSFFDMLINFFSYFFK